MLLSGDHARIARWRRVQAIWITWRERPDLLATARLTQDERKLVERFERGETPEQMDDPAWKGSWAVMDAIRLVEAAQLKKDRAGFAPGDTVRVHVKVIEGEKERLQLFEGIVIRRRGEGGRASFTVRRISYGVGVERTFPLHSPRIERVEVARRSRVRRSKLYYLRGLAGKAARLKEKRMPLVPATGATEQ